MKKKSLLFSVSHMYNSRMNEHKNLFRTEMFVFLKRITYYLVSMDSWTSWYQWQHNSRQPCPGRCHSGNSVWFEWQYSQNKKYYYKKKSHAEWQKYWESSSQIKGKHLFRIMPKISRKPWFDTLELYRSLSVQIVSLRIGLAITPEYLYRIDFRNDPFCDCGSDEVGDINQTITI